MSNPWLVPLRNTKIEEVRLKTKAKKSKLQLCSFAMYNTNPSEITVYLYIAFPCFAMHTDFLPNSALAIDNIIHVPWIKFPFSLVLRLCLQARLDHLSLE